MATETIVETESDRTLVFQDDGIDALTTAFIESQDIKQTSKDTYRRALRPFLSWVRTERVQQPDREDILSYKRNLESRQVSPLTLSAYLVAVRKFFEWAESKKFYPNIARGIKGAKRVRGFRKDPLTVAQVKDLLSSIDRTKVEGKRNYALINLLVRTGLRTIEVVRADVGDIRQESGEAVLQIQGKGRDAKDDFVLLTNDALQPIREYHTARGGAVDADPLFTSHSDRNKNERLTTRTFSRIVKERLRSIGLDSERLTAHSLRHSSITLCLQAGASIQEAQALARHANINTTLIYAHNIDRISNAPERKIDALLKDSAVAKI